MRATPDGASPEEILRKVPPPDDVGAETADRFEWQAMMATADILGMYFKALDDAGNLVAGVPFSMICEHHEDWALTRGQDSEIVSGKHREASVGPFSTYKQVLDEGGVLHLFDRWQTLNQTPLCRLVTTGGLREDGAKVARACERLRTDRAAQDGDVLDAIEGLRNAMVSLRTTNGISPSPESDEVLRAFLAALRLTTAQPRRDQVPDLAGERYGRPVAERLGRPDGGMAVWQAALAIVRPRMRAAGASIGGRLPTVLGLDHDDSLASRTLTLEDVHTAARFAIQNVSGYAPLPRIIKANRMALKMTQGGCSDNAVERADELRLQYRRYRRARRSTPGTSDQQRRLDNTVSRVVDEATDHVRSDGGTWGAQLWRELGDRFQALEGKADAQGLSADLLLGGVSELANSCRVWYTDRFDAQAMLRKLTAEEAAS